MPFAVAADNSITQTGATRAAPETPNNLLETNGTVSSSYTDSVAIPVVGMKVMVINQNFNINGFFDTRGWTFLVATDRLIRTNASTGVWFMGSRITKQGVSFNHQGTV